MITYPLDQSKTLPKTGKSLLIFCYTKIGVCKTKLQCKLILYAKRDISDMKNFLRFALTVILAHTVTYLIAGGIAYPLLTKPLYEGSDPVFTAFMRSPADPNLWQFVMKWFIPAQVLRGLLMAIALYPFYETLQEWSFGKRFLSLAGLYLIFGYWAAAVAAPGTIDGVVYMRPEYLGTHLIVQLEIIVQGLALAAWVGWWIGRRRLKLGQKQVNETAMAYTVR